MSLEAATWVADLVTTNPTPTDPKSQGDDHLRLLKTVLQATFAGFPGPVLVVGAEAQGATVNDYVLTVSPAPASYVDRMLVLFKATHANLAAATFQVNALAAVPLSGVDQAALVAGDIENDGWCLVAYDGAVPSAVLLSGSDRVSRHGDTITGTLAIVGALTITGGLATLAALTVTGAANFVTQAAGDNTTRAATTQFVTEALIGSSFGLPGQAGRHGMVVTSINGAANWHEGVDQSRMAGRII